jgi:hypothetical protein
MSGINPAELPAELPESPGTGGDFVPRPRPSPELPISAASSTFLNDLLTELVQTRNRLHALEIQQLVSRFRPRGPGPGPQELPAFTTRARFLPNELPEGGEGGGTGGVIPRPGEINELPVDFSRFATEISQLSSRLTQLETRLTTQLQGLTQQMQELRR